MTIVSSALLKEQIKRFWPLIPITCLGYLLFIILPLYVYVMGNNHHDSAELMIAVLTMQHPFIIASTVLVPFCAVMTLFSYMFSENAAIGFYGYSKNKGQLFWTNVLAGFFLILAPLVVLAVGIFIGVVYPPGVEVPLALFPDGGIEVGQLINTMPALGGFFLRLIIALLFYFSMFLFVCTLAGNGLSALLLNLLFPILFTVLYALSIAMASVYVVGLDLSNALSPQMMLRHSNPIMWYQSFGTENPMLFYLAFSVASLILLIAANVCFHKRKLEHIGNAVVFESFKMVLIFLISLAGMIVIGRFYITLASGRLSIYYGYTLGFAIAFCLSMMLFEQSFYIMHRIKLIIPSVIIMVLMYVSIMVVTLFGTRFYTHHIPERPAVVGVYVSNEAPWTVDVDFNTSADAIARTLAVHEQIVDELCYLHDVLWESITGGGRHFEYRGGQHLYLAYQLENGGIMFRRYALSGDFIDRVGLRALW